MAGFAEELALARTLALEAARVILEVYATSFEVIEKDLDKGPVTEADRRANTLIVEGIRRAFPTDSILAEETERADQTGSSRAWFIDPLDGTREFVLKNGQFAVHIGLAVDAVPVMGVVYAPVSGTLFCAASGGPAVMETAGGARRELRLTPPADLRELHLVVSRSNRSPRTDAIMRELGITRVSEQGSVGLKVGMILEGKADLYLHPMPRSSRWDTCAPEAVLRAAGGVLTDIHGAPYRYDAEELDNVRGIIACAPEVHGAVLPRLHAMMRRGDLPPPR